jgi:cell wall-associated NlpC family hydrolase
LRKWLDLEEVNPENTKKMGGKVIRRGNLGRLLAVAIRISVPATVAASLFFLLFLSACGPLVRPYYNRDVGGYLQPDPSMTPTAKVPASLKGLKTDDDRLRKTAESWLGVPYDFGGQSRSGIDCSGFIRQVFAEVYGVRLPHNSSAIYRMGTEVSRSDLRPGDVVFFKNLGYIDHSGIYMGKNWFIHSASSVGVAYSALNAPYFGDHYAGARRLIDAP